MCVYVSSVVSKRTVPLYRASLALHWLSALHITLCWLPALNIALVWLQTTRFFITRAPNMIIRLEVELQLQTLHLLPALNIAIHWLPQLGSSSQGLQTGSRFETPYPTPTPYTGSIHPVQGPNINTRSLRAS